MSTPSAGRAAEPWRRLTDLAAAEQRLLEQALASLFADTDLDLRIAQALGYPSWPQPLTLLPDIAPDLAAATAELASYLSFSEQATARALQTLSVFGWPRQDRDGLAAGDAAWLLLQHADRCNGDRAAVLPDLAQAVEAGDADPRHLALLTDRERAVRGEAQRYATFVLVRDDVPEYLYPVEDPHRVDQHRAHLGLPALSADGRYAFSPIIPFGPARTTPVNPWHPGHAELITHEPPEPVTDESGQPPGSNQHRTTVYLAATLRHRNEVRRIRDRLQPPLASTARWLDIDPLTRPSCQFDAGVALNRLAARLCLADIRRADTVIAIQHTRRSAGVGAEIGHALAHRKPIVLVGPPACSFDMLPQVTLVADIDAALARAADGTHRAGTEAEARPTAAASRQAPDARTPIRPDTRR